MWFQLPTIYRDIRQVLHRPKHLSLKHQRSWTLFILSEPNKTSYSFNIAFIIYHCTPPPRYVNACTRFLAHSCCVCHRSPLVFLCHRNPSVFLCHHNLCGFLCHLSLPTSDVAWILTKLQKSFLGYEHDKPITLWSMTKQHKTLIQGKAKKSCNLRARPRSCVWGVNEEQTFYLFHKLCA